MDGIELTHKQVGEDMDESFPIEDDSIEEDMQQDASFDTVDVDAEEDDRGNSTNGFGQPLAVLAVTDRVKKKAGTALIPKMAKAGNVYCFWHDSRGVPRITIGPSWPFSIVLVVYAGFLSWVHLTAFAELIRLSA